MSTPPPGAAGELRPAPRSWCDLQGTPRFGKFRGALDRMELAGIRASRRPGIFLRGLRTKRWLFACAATPEAMLGMALVDLGYCSHAFVYAADLAAGEILFERSSIGPPLFAVRIGEAPDAGLDARYGWAGLALAARRPVGSPAILLTGRDRAGFELDAELTVAGRDALSVVAPVPEVGRVHGTVKRAALPVSGSLTVRGRRIELDGGVGGTDFSLGEPARRTSWRWAMAGGLGPLGSPVGFNFVEGFNEAPPIDESALWVEGELIPLPRVQFSCGEAGGRGHWRVHSTDGRVELAFRAFHVHREETNLVLVRSRFLQHLGRFDGRIRLADGELTLAAMPGVLEDQDVLW